VGKSVQEVMSSRPRAVTGDTPVNEVARLMKDEDVGAIPLVDGDRVVAMVTDRDIVVRAVARDKDPRGMPAREVASADVVTVQADTDLSEALQLMARNQLRRLPVVDQEDRLIGIVSQADVAVEVKEKTVGELLQEVSQPPSGPRL
jgi:CBS domain-containing protein